MLEPWPLVLIAFACFRAVRFLIYDSLMGANLESGSKFSQALDRFAYSQGERGQPIGADRSWIRGKIGDLLNCLWCTGWWVALAAVCVWARLWPWQLGVEGWYSVAAVAGLAALLNVIERRLVR